GIDMAHIAYKASPLAHVDLLGGQVQVMFDGLPAAIPLVKAGRLRALGVTAAKRSVMLPEVPTIAESGLPGYEAVNWQAIAAPAGTPREIINKLNTEIVRTLNDPEMQERLRGQGAEVAGNTPEEFAAFIKAETQKWAKVVKESGARVD
ncbi:MAG TPA: tripartite tricarboxylate transporter substrate-binding protein, partial [Burkholderiales bacterium]|nr:tripartite tricarboxylate transporter substrate-binding protein [Burkholderiales bacterium]